MKTKLALLAILALSACDSEPPDKPAPKVEVPTKGAIKKEVDRGVKDVLEKRGPKWKVTYSGDLKGSIEGGIMTAMKVGPNMTVVGAGMNKDNTGKAPESFRATITGPAGKETPMVSLTLADGTKCSPNAASAKTPSTVSFTEPDPKKLRGEVKGALGCGDKTITYTATVNAKP